MDTYLQSKLWDMDISLDELLNHNDQCMVDRNYKPHKSDDCYRGYCIYVKHPVSLKCDTMIGIYVDGFTYIGNGSPDKEFPFENTIDVVKEMLLYRDWLLSKELNESRVSYYLIE